MRLVGSFILVALLAGVSSGGEADPRPSTVVSIYSAADPASFDPALYLSQSRTAGDGGLRPLPGHAQVKEVREVDLVQGANVVDLVDVAAEIDPTTVLVENTGDPSSMRVLEQRFLFDLASSAKVLRRHIGHRVTLMVAGRQDPERVEGTLLDASGEAGSPLVIQTTDGLRLVESRDIRLGAVPGGIVIKPTLRLHLESTKAGRQRISVAYRAASLTWRADYRLVLAQDERSGSFGALVTIANMAGATWPGARLKLIAGEVRVEDPPSVSLFGAAGGGFLGPAGGPTHRPLFEYHLYEVGHPTDIIDRSTHQVVLFPDVRNVAVEKVLVYDGAGMQEGPGRYVNVNEDFGVTSHPQVTTYLSFANTEQNHLGIPLPRGRVRVFTEDPSDHNLEFIGENVIDHAPKGKTIRLELGRSFDVTGERKRTAYTYSNRENRLTETFAITVRNAKERPQRVLVKEALSRWGNWEILKKSSDFTKLDANTVHFPVDVPAGGETTVTYTVRYTWEFNNGKE